MARAPIAESARTVLVSMRTTERERDRINTLRGSLSVSDYLRGLVTADERRRRPTPEGITTE